MALVKLSGERKASERAVRPLTFAEYLKSTRPVLVQATGPQHRGEFLEVRWNGQPKTWKTRSGQVDRPVKYGMYECFHVGTVPGLVTASTLA